MRQKSFFITFKGHSWKQIKTTFLELESRTLKKLQAEEILAVVHKYFFQLVKYLKES